MLARLANLGIRFPRRVLGLAGLVLVAAAIFGAPVSAHLSSGGFSDPGSPSSQADDLLASKFDPGDPNLILEVSSPDGVDSAGARAQGLNLVHDLQGQRYASQITSYWTVPAGRSGALRSNDGRSALVVARIAGDDSTAPKRADAITAPLVGSHEGVTVAAGGIVSHDPARSTTRPRRSDAFRDDRHPAHGHRADLGVRQFRRRAAAARCRVVLHHRDDGDPARASSVTDVSIYALNMTTAMGLALAIDYSLFIVSRYREEVRGGSAPDAAVRRTMQTAGRTVLFSALTVGLSLAAMLVFPVYFLRSFAYAGIAVVALATFAALILLPAVLTVLGPRVDALDLRAFVRRVLGRPPPAVKPIEESFWYRFASAVMRRALPVGLVVTALLVALGSPFLHAHFGYPDDHVLPQSAAAHQVGDDLRTQFSSNAASTITAVAADISAAPASAAAYTVSLSRIPGVTGVTSSAGTFVAGQQVAPPSGPSLVAGSATYLTLHTNADGKSPAGKQVLAAARAVPAPWPVQFTGQTAEDADSLHALAATMPIAIVLIALATFVDAVPVHRQPRAAASRPCCSTRSRCRRRSARWSGCSRRATSARCSRI